MPSLKVVLISIIFNVILNVEGQYDGPEIVEHVRIYGYPHGEPHPGHLHHHEHYGHPHDHPHGHPHHHPYGHPHGGHPYGGHPLGGHPHGGHPYGGHPHGGHPHGGHPYGGPHHSHPGPYAPMSRHWAPRHRYEADDDDESPKRWAPIRSHWGPTGPGRDERRHVSGFAGGGGPHKSETESVKAPPLKPHQMEFSKRFWKKLNSEQKPKKIDGAKARAKGGGGKGKGKGPKSFSGDDYEDMDMHRDVANYGKIMPSGGMVFFDDLVWKFFPVGDAYGGLPDNIISMGLYCVNTLLNGAIAIVYTTIRWPHKILLKTMIVIAAVSFLPTNAMYCLNPLSMANFVKKGAIINTKQTELATVTKEFQTRLANSIDRIPTMMGIKKHSCCAFFDWRNKVIKTAPSGGRDFIEQYFTMFFTIHEVIYCQIFTKDQEDKYCKDFDFIDLEPNRELPRSWVTLVIELFVQFF